VPIVTTYFLSDVHLGLGPPEQERRKEDTLLEFFGAILPQAQQLFIVGDLFDLWFEYTTVIPKGFFRTLAALESFTRRGVEVHYLAGNHDYWMEDFFKNELGVKTHREPFEISLHGKRLFLHHGDGLIGKDVGYRLIRPILRNPVSILLYRWLHPDIGIRLARRSSRTSRAYTSRQKIADDRDMTAFATERIRQGIDIVIMGHQHYPAYHVIEGGVYINLGDWISHRTYAEMTGEGVRLLRWQGTAGAAFPRGQEP
jgi:UDP-2,3-diacylglucosamine hydrolase